MNQLSVGRCPQPEDSGMVKTGKIVCGYCIVLAVAIPVVLVGLAVLAKILGYI